MDMHTCTRNLTPAAASTISLSDLAKDSGAAAERVVSLGRRRIRELTLTRLH